MTTTTVILSALLAVTAVLLGRSRIINHRLHRRNKRLKSDIEFMTYANDKPFTHYFKGTACICNEVCPAVLRQAVVAGQCYFTVIKVFNTTDSEYNENCATELAAKLNEELCYD